MSINDSPAYPPRTYRVHRPPLKLRPRTRTPRGAICGQYYKKWVPPIRNSLRQRWSARSGY